MTFRALLFGDRQHNRVALLPVCFGKEDFCMPDRQRETSSLRPEATPVALETIDWEHARLLSAAGA
jgi:hypothetical protein